MINKIVKSAKDAVRDVKDESIILIGGFGEAGSPVELIHALIDQGAKNLTVVSNNAGSGYVGLAALINQRRVKKMICSFPRTQNSEVFTDLFLEKKIDLELVPQGTLAERIRAGGAGIPAFYTPTSVDTPLQVGKELRMFNGEKFVLEHSIKADYAFVKCEAADRYGNLIYNKTARNFGPIMCTAATVTIVQARRLVELGDIDPEIVVTPGIFVNRVVEINNSVKEGRR